MLQTVDTWKDKQAYEKQAEDLKNRFRSNFTRFASQVGPEIRGVM
jgi:ATP-dependent phosphoenolpyruvate carboxykinase